MHQSPDDIFAARFWTWPDPALKRDSLGRVLFVNAAFLQLFGGRVEDWRGQTVQGWPIPQPGPMPSRFEIRTPATPTQDEQVFDWLELCEADGSGFALARNVTVFASAPPPDAPHALSQLADAPVGVVAQPVDAAPVYADEPVLAEPELPPVAQAAVADPVIEVPDIEVPDIDVPQITAEPAPVINAPDPAPVAAAPAIEPPAPAAAAPEPIAMAAPADIHAPSVAPEPSDAPDRAYERRALPIENGDSVLGNNWRDAVIAKAVGAVDDTDEGAQVDVADAGPTDAAGGSIRILLAEDNAINALLTRTLLEAEGHTVETVEDGQLAFEAMKTSSFDMIFMDMRMPNMDGLEATRKIRALPNVSNDLPIVALTANAFDDDRNACFDSGMNDFMTKPVSAEELSDMVARWTGAEEKALAS